MNQQNRKLSLPDPHRLVETARKKILASITLKGDIFQAIVSTVSDLVQGAVNGANELGFGAGAAALAAEDGALKAAREFGWTGPPSVRDVVAEQLRCLTLPLSEPQSPAYYSLPVVSRDSSISLP